MINIKKIIPNINQYIRPDMRVYESNERSHEGLIVPEITMKYGHFKGKIRTYFPLVPTMLKLLAELKKSYREVVRQPESAKTIISGSGLKEFLIFSEALGVNSVGYTTVDPSYIFKDKKILFKNAIVLLMEMKKDKISMAPSPETHEEIMRTYYKLGVAANQLTGFLKDKGYKAQAGPALGGEVNYPLLAQKAGLGAIGKHGLLITPEFGPSLRIAAIYTDIVNLPVNMGNKHLWVKEFCDLCNRCVRKCPSGAIYKDTVVFEDQTEQHINYRKCIVPFTNQHGCTICVKECLFFTEGYMAIQSKMAKLTR